MYLKVILEIIFVYNLMQVIKVFYIKIIHWEIQDGQKKSFNISQKKLKKNIKILNIKNKIIYLNILINLLIK